MLNLGIHCGARAVDRAQLTETITPSHTDTWLPIPHSHLLDTVESTPTDTGLQVVNQAHHLLIKLSDAKVLPVTRLPGALREFREPSHDDFLDQDRRTAWTLKNGVTEAIKSRNLNELPKRTQPCTACSTASATSPGTNHSTSTLTGEPHE